ncbi:hypothetical protein N6H14_02785 [Paenibacillus sp. CC-CFT747]|nr:hypothetical protein N6H14_02785 [Paenibacillus sp. CC-CFT747]
MRAFPIVMLFSFLLTGCTTAEEKFSSKWVSRDEGLYQVYLVYADSAQMKLSFNKALLDLTPYQSKIENISGMYDMPEAKEAFGLKQFPAALVFDSEKLLLKTSSYAELQRFFRKAE